MKADEFPTLLRELTVSGVSVRPADGEPGSGLQYGILMEDREGARIAWQVALYTDDKAESKTGPPTAFPAVVPARSAPPDPAAAEASIAAWLGLSVAADSIQDIQYYSADPGRAIQFGLKITLHNGERVFIQKLWSRRSGRPEAKG
ncbi:hypothetical protein [Streptomyces cucumeris]|uniref:hypothetical protein n=1 Tax=Streptomyces cucumeris TaxID=2962890 RepID=UPI0020C8AAFE|nr:hypothetical protein [Streptomyces sp. NEAU-Y11]MCP9209581.1 hypothetical protein [Streptomyces sp. NEAU-Y11]